jgi:putative transposase
MLTDREFDQWCGQRNLPIAAIGIIRDIRNSPPSRRVGGGRQNVPGSYPSRKMQCTLQFESHTVELPLVYQLELDEDVLEYYCQPSPIELHYDGPTGRAVVALHTPDYFAIRRNSAGWIEAKCEEQLPILAKKSPNRYQLVNDRWECPPGKAYAVPLGLCYDLHSSAYVSPTFVRNVQFLDDYLRCDAAVPPDAVAKVALCLCTHLAITLQDLLAELQGEVSPDHLYQMVAESTIFIDWRAAPLVEPERVRVFADRVTAIQFHAGVKRENANKGMIDISPGAMLAWDGKPWQVLNSGLNNVSLLGENQSLVDLPLVAMESLIKDGRLVMQKRTEKPSEHPEVQHRMSIASPRELQLATERAKEIQPYLDGSRAYSSYSISRTYPSG